MSLVLAIQQKDKYILASDTAVCTNINGIPYRVKDLSLSKLYVLDNTGYFFAGDVDICMTVKDAFFAQSDHTVNRLKEIAIQEWEKTPNDNIYISVFGFDQKGHTKTTIFSSGTDFEDVLYHGHKRDQYIAYGFRMNDILPVFYDNMMQYNPEQSLIRSFQVISCEEVGNNIEIHELSTKKHKYQKHKLKEPDNLRQIKMNAYFNGSGHSAYPASSWGLGTGTGSDDDFSGRGKGYIYKDADEFVLKYNQRMTSNPRQIKLNDQGISIDTPNGTFETRARDLVYKAEGQLKLEHSNGSYIEIAENGDININATGNITINGKRIDINT